MAGCKQGPGATDQSVVPGADLRAVQGVAAGVSLPAPLPLPAQPDTLLHIQDPQGTAMAAETWAPGRVNPKAWLAMELRNFIDPAMVETLVAAIDLAQPWDAVEWPGGQILHVALLSAELAALQARLAELPPQGKFGAVSLPTPPGAPPNYAWARDTAQGPRLTLASSEAALVSGISLATTYGRAPIVGAADLERLRLPLDRIDQRKFKIPVVRVSAEGTVEDLLVELTLAEGEDPFGSFELAPGAMRELLADPGTLAGISSRYSGYKVAVSRVISQIQAQIDELPFLLKGLATDLARRFNAIVRSWDGRVLVATANGHVRVAYGAPDANKSGVAVLHFMRGALDGLSLVRNFSSEVPDIRLKKNVARSGDIEVHRVDIRGAKRLAPELKALLDENGALHVAMAFDAKFAGGIVVVGPRADAEAVKWIEGTQKAVGSIQDAPEVALRVALSAEQIATLARAAAGEGLSAATLWGWKTQGPPVDIELRQVDATHLRARIRGPRQAQPIKVLQLALPAQPATSAP